MSFSPSLLHAIGDAAGGRVRLTPVTNAGYGYVKCEYPDEFLQALKYCCSDSTWIECDDGSMLHLRYVIKAEVEA